MKSSFVHRLNNPAGKVAFLYGLVGILWILFSDQIVAVFIQDPEQITFIQTGKGFLYVLVTALLVYYLVKTFAGERSLADEKLHRNEKLYRDFVERSDDLVSQVNEQGIFTYVNARSQMVFGLPPEECLGLCAFDFIHPEDRERAEGKLHQALQQGLTSIEFENRQMSRQGTLTWVLWSTNIHYRQDGSVESINSIGHDITQRKQLEEMLIHNEKMISIGSLAAGMAHEINNPIAGVVQNAQVLQRRLNVDSPKSQRLAHDFNLLQEGLKSYYEKLELGILAQNIRDQGNRVGQIVADILDFSRYKVLSPIPTDICELLNQSVELASKEFDLSANYDFRSIRIVYEYSNELPPLVCDRSRMQQVFINLLRNGAHAMLTWPQPDRQPTFFLRVRLVEDFCEVQIEDNGIGMDEETCRRIFEPFFTTKEVGQGTGLGMFVAYFIVVEHHGGKLMVSSTPGEGSCFIIRLPLKAPERKVA